MPYIDEIVTHYEPHEGNKVTFLMWSGPNEPVATLSGKFVGFVQFISYSTPYAGLVNDRGEVTWCNANDVRQIINQAWDQVDKCWQEPDEGKSDKEEDKESEDDHDPELQL